MPLPGQASGGWTESSAALRILYAGIRNSIAQLTDDAYTQTNPCAVATSVSTRVDVTKVGVLSGSVAFVRPDAGSPFIGGPGSNAVQTAINAALLQRQGYRPLGIFVNSANGNAFENQPGVASGNGPYMSGQGTYGNQLYETACIGDAVGGDPPATTAVPYAPGQTLISSRNGYIMPGTQLDVGAANIISMDDTTMAAESFVAGVDNSSTVLGIVKMPPDAVMAEVVYDQRI
mgnify:CR=1 FL=1